LAIGQNKYLLIITSSNIKNIIDVNVKIPEIQEEFSIESFNFKVF
jgi:hypothetical protein